MADVKHWDRHSDADKAEMKRLLLPLVAASRCADFADVASARVQVAAFLQALQDIPKGLVEQAIAHRIAAGVTWMPKPGEIKADCVKLRTEQRTAAARLHLADCPHSSHFVEREDGRMERCPCWKQARHAMDSVGEALTLPPPPSTLEQEGA